MTTPQMVLNLKQNNEDFEWYPTTKEMKRKRKHAKQQNLY